MVKDERFHGKGKTREGESCQSSEEWKNMGKMRGGMIPQINK